MTDAGGGGSTDTQPRSSFQFDLGSALARLSGSVDPGSLSGEGSPATPTVDETPVAGPDEGQTGVAPDARPTMAPGELAEDAVPVRGRSDDASVEPLPVRGRSDDASVEPLPVRDRSDDASVEPLPVRGRSDDASVEPLPVRDRSDDASVEPLPVRGRPDDASVEPLPVRDRSDDASVEPLPVRGRSDDASVEPLPTRARLAETAAPEGPAVADRLPTRTPRSVEPTPVSAGGPPTPAVDRPAARQASKRSVFDDVSPAPTLPAAGSPTVPSPTASSPMVSTRPDGPTVPPTDASTTGMPTLPAPVPAAHPPVVAPVESAPSTPELNALRSAQIRANRNDRRGKLMGRSVLAVVVLGALVGAALLFGRSYLFPTEWTAELTPIVDEVQSDRDAEFEETLAFVERPGADYAPSVAEHVLGEDWSTRLPEWRALGLAGGDGAVADVQLRVASLYPAFYDSESETLIAAEGVSPETRRPALRLALETALTEQLGDGDAPTTAGLGLTGLEAIDAVARRAVDAAETGIAGNAPDAVADLAGVPLPVAYQLRAFDELGVDLLADAGPAGAAAPLPESAARLDDGAQLAVGGLRQPGDQVLLEPVALGADDWALIWGARLPQTTAGRLADSLVADSYSVASRSGATCFLAVFEVDSDVAGATLLAELTTWVGNAPAGSQALATQLGPTRVQLEACDPGPDAAVAPGVGSVDLVLQRQLDRLAAG